MLTACRHRVGWTPRILGSALQNVHKIKLWAVRLLAAPDVDDVLWVKVEFRPRCENLGVLRFVVQKAGEVVFIGRGDYNPHVFRVKGLALDGEGFGVMEDELYNVTFLDVKPFVVSRNWVFEEALPPPVIEFNWFKFIAISLESGVGIIVFAHTLYL